MQGLAVQALNTIAPIAANYVVDAAVNFLSDDTPTPMYSTDQTAYATNANLANTASGTREQLDYNLNLANQQALSNQRLMQNQMQFTGNMANAAQNATASRDSMAAAQNTLNQVYQQSQGNINQAAEATQNALNQASAIAASMFAGNGGNRYR